MLSRNLLEIFEERWANRSKQESLAMSSSSRLRCIGIMLRRSGEPVNRSQRTLEC